MPLSFTPLIHFIVIDFSFQVHAKADRNHLEEGNENLVAWLLLDLRYGDRPVAGTPMDSDNRNWTDFLCATVLLNSAILLLFFLPFFLIFASELIISSVVALV